MAPVSRWHELAQRGSDGAHEGLLRRQVGLTAGRPACRRSRLSYFTDPTGTWIDKLPDMNSSPGISVSVSRPNKTSLKQAKPALIELEHCSLVLGDRTVLRDVNFSLRPGQRWALVGANGAGKTQFLKLLRGDVWPTPDGKERRTYCFDGEPQYMPAGVKQLIAYVGPERQDRYVRYDWNFTLRQVVATGLFDEDFPLSKPDPAQRARVNRLLRRFGLWALRNRNMLEVSYGQRRITLVARAFAGQPRILLLDEPFNGLDERARNKLRSALQRNGSGSASWILTSHRGAELPNNVTDRASISHGVLKVEDDMIKLSRSRKATARRRLGLNGAQVVSSVSERAAGHHRREPLIQIKNTALYREHRAVLKDLDWSIEAGEHWAIQGSNGSGKSTLLLLLHGDLHPAHGGSIVRSGMPRGSRIEAWKRRIGFVSPELQADFFLSSSLEEIVVSGRYASVGLNEPMSRGDRAAATRWLKFFGLEQLRNRGPREVSYGQLRLALIARALVNSPQALLLDEPCTGLDPDMRAHLVELLDTVARSGTQLIMAVHEPEDIPAAVTKLLKIRRDGTTVQAERESGRA